MVIFALLTIQQLRCMMELVEVKRNVVFCDSHMVARKFNQKHAEVVKRIKRLESDLAELRVVSNYPKTITEDREYRGSKYTSYLMGS
jgi:phage regulator Rha-like protein